MEYVCFRYPYLLKTDSRECCERFLKYKTINRVYRYSPLLGTVVNVRNLFGYLGNPKVSRRWREIEEKIEGKCFTVDEFVKVLLPYKGVNTYAGVMIRFAKAAEVEKAKWSDIVTPREEKPKVAVIHLNKSPVRVNRAGFIYTVPRARKFDESICLGIHFGHPFDIRLYMLWYSRSMWLCTDDNVNYVMCVVLRDGWTINDVAKLGDDGLRDIEKVVRCFSHAIDVRFRNHSAVKKLEWALKLIK